MVSVMLVLVVIAVAASVAISVHQVDSVMVTVGHSDMGKTFFLNLILDKLGFGKQQLFIDSAQSSSTKATLHSNTQEIRARLANVGEFSTWLCDMPGLTESENIGNDLREALNEIIQHYGKVTKVLYVVSIDSLRDAPQKTIDNLIAFKDELSMSKREFQKVVKLVITKCDVDQDGSIVENSAECDKLIDEIHAECDKLIDEIHNNARLRTHPPLEVLRTGRLNRKNLLADFEKWSTQEANDLSLNSPILTLRDSVVRPSLITAIASGAIGIVAALSFATSGALAIAATGVVSAGVGVLIGAGVSAAVVAHGRYIKKIT